MVMLIVVITTLSSNKEKEMGNGMNSMIQQSEALMSESLLKKHSEDKLELLK